MKEIELPDFEDMYTSVSEIQKLTLEVKLLETEIEADEASITQRVTSDSEYFVNGKPPSVAYMKSAYLVTGLDGELLDKRQKLAELESKLETAKMRYELDKIVIDVWRTQSANKRKAVD